MDTRIMYRTKNTQNRPRFGLFLCSLFCSNVSFTSNAKRGQTEQEAQVIWLSFHVWVCGPYFIANLPPKLDIELQMIWAFLESTLYRSRYTKKDNIQCCYAIYLSSLSSLVLFHGKYMLKVLLQKIRYVVLFCYALCLITCHMKYRTHVWISFMWLYNKI